MTFHSLPPSIFLLCALLLCSCASEPRPPVITPALDLPADTIINPDATTNDLLIITVRLEDGEKLPLIVDTGSPRTVLDRSLEPKLGKSIGNMSVWTLNTDQVQERMVYATPKLYLGDTPLMTGDAVSTSDFQHFLGETGRPVMGILGMDCLKHYCLQLDFTTGHVRFLQPAPLDATALGRAFPITYSSVGQSTRKLYCPYIHAGSLIGNHGTMLSIDTGLDADGSLTPVLFRREVRAHAGGLLFTNAASGHSEIFHVLSEFPQCAWQGETCTNLVIQRLPDRATNAQNSIGLRFLMRHLVTFDFPENRLYLKLASPGPVAEDSYTECDALAQAESFMGALIHSREAPGESSWVHGNLTLVVHTGPDTATCELTNDHDPREFHYKIRRQSYHSPWKLVKAWSTGKNGKVIKNYRIRHRAKAAQPSSGN